MGFLQCELISNIGLKAILMLLDSLPVPREQILVSEPEECA
jgi:hypothetical protein